MKKSVCIYHYQYLPFSETFIYRQFQGLKPHFYSNILTRKIENLDEFPGFDPILIPQERKRFGMSFNSEKRFFCRYLKNSDLFHVNFGHIAVHLQQHAVRADIPMSVQFHGVDASACLKESWYVKALSKAKFQTVVVCSENMKTRLTPYLPKGMKCFVSYYGIPLDRFPFKQRHAVPDGAIFLQISRLDYKKGLDVTIKAFAQYLRETDPKAKLVIAGDGPLLNDLKSLAISLNIVENVNFLGVVKYKKLIELLHTSDAFLHPSVTDRNGDMEGIPNAIAEAMATGLPVISTRHSGIPELISCGENGFLAEEADVQGLFDKMVELKSSNVGAISINARTKVEQQFNQDVTFGHLANHLNSVMR